MTYWDRFDIYAAYSHFIDSWRYGHFNTAIAPGDTTVRDAVFQYETKLDSMRHQPGLSDSQLRTISSNAKAIYMSLVRKHIGVHSTAPENPWDDHLWDCENKPRRWEEGSFISL